MLEKVISKNTRRKVIALKPFIRGNESLLDFGCGDMNLASELKGIYPKTKITGVDVVDFGNKLKSIDFVKYDGLKLPFPANKFDIVLAYHVLHHCSDPLLALGECTRVARKKIILVEPVPRSPLEEPVMRILDVLFNIWKDHKIPMNFKFLSKKRWLSEFRKSKLKLNSTVDVEVLPAFVPSGRSLLFELYKKS